MDLRVYYQKVRQVEAGLTEADVVVVSHETPEGGRAGVRSEVSKRTAAQMVVSGKARLATAGEAAEFREETAAARQAIEQERAASRVQFTVAPESDLRWLRGGTKAKS
jgi:hypothetical protein